MADASLPHLDPIYHAVFPAGTLELRLRAAQAGAYLAELQRLL